jgi:hypothetical protein
MTKFAKINPDLEIVQTISAQLSWSHDTALLNKLKDKKNDYGTPKKSLRTMDA